ncbi:unnamed protein product [Spirodela intermedia]|uniref:Uncharacterized protein n=1 Tax=Spirodela intermedia TaxID=51605 RepID=A0A7I8L2F7_SPIIN|nr:unnamed protein product [Spirodela intermedia]
MDLLRGAYGAPSDEEDDEGTTVGPAAKRVRSEGYPQQVLPPPAVRRREFSGAGVPSELVSAGGRYVSKRERARLAAEASSSSGITELNTPVSTSVTTPVVRGISDLDIPHNALSILRHQVKDNVRHDKESRKPTVVLSGHKKAVNAVQWSRTHAHLLASAGMDQTVCVWNVWSQENQRARVLTYHAAAVKDVRWSPRGLSLLSCGYDCCSRMVDVDKGVEEQVFKEDQVVDVVKFHPDNPNLFLSGGLKGSLRLWDIRTGNVAQEYIKPLGPILDVEFSPDGRHFISSSDVSQSNASENSIIVWDVSRQIPLSNQVYVEAYTCPCVRYHPWESCFVAQSNGNYVAIFSGRAPFKLDRYRRFEGHWVSGFPVRCDFSADGDVLGSGSADGAVYLYSFRSSELLTKMDAFGDACVDVAFHPAVKGVVAACGWDGGVAVFRC